MRSVLEPRRWYRNVLAWLVLLAIVVIAGMSIYTYRAYQQASSELLIERDRQVAVLSAARLRSEMTKFSDVLDSLSRSIGVFSGDVDEQRRLLAEAATRLAVFDAGVLLLDNQGVIVAAEPAQPELVGEDRSSREYFRSLLGDETVFISDSVNDGPDHAPIIAISVSVLGPRSNFTGALVGMFLLGEPNQSSFYASIVRLRLGQTGSAYLFDGKGRVLFDNDLDRVGHFLTTQELALVAGPSESDALRTVNTEGVEIVASFAPVPQTDWTLVVEDDWELLTSSARRYSNLFLLSLAVGIALPPLGVGIMIRQRRFRRLQLVNPAEREVITEAVASRLLPTTVPMLPGWNIVARHDQGRGPRRDFYDAAILPDGRLMLTLGQAHGQALEAALGLATARTMLRAAADRMDSAGEALRACDRILAGSFGDPLVVSCSLALVDPVSGQVDYAYAGQPPPQTKRTFQADPGAIPEPLGIGRPIDPAVGSLTIEHGDCLLLIGRSVLDTGPPANRSFGQLLSSQLMGHVYPTTESMADNLLAEYEDFCTEHGLVRREMSVIVLERFGRDPNGGNQ